MNIKKIEENIENNNIKFKTEQDNEFRKKMIFDNNIEKISGYDFFNLFVKNIPEKSQCSGGVMKSQLFYDERYDLIRELFQKVLNIFNPQIKNINCEVDGNNFKIVLEKVKEKNASEVYDIIFDIVKCFSKEINVEDGIYGFEIMDKLRLDVINFFSEVYSDIDEYWHGK